MLDDLKQRIRSFAKDRDWEEYHSPKNLAIGLTIEAGELLEIFLWLSEEQSKMLGEKRLQELRDEIGDVMIFLTNLADKFGLDPVDCAWQKLAVNERKYPPQLVKGSARKYSEYREHGPLED